MKTVSYLDIYGIFHNGCFHEMLVGNISCSENKFVSYRGIGIEFSLYLILSYGTRCKLL